jgi:hypothetical protein
MSTGVQSLLDDVTVEGNPESSDDFAINNARHITYRGDDIADSFLNQFKIHSEFDRDNIKHAVTTKGGREFFIVTESNDLEMIWVTHRLRLPYEGPFTCIRSTCIVNTKQKCRGATIVFKLTSSTRCRWRRYNYTNWESALSSTPIVQSHICRLGIVLPFRQVTLPESAILPGWIPAW